MIFKVMTVDQFLIRDTDDLVHTSDRTFYPLKIPIAHPQLRHFINAQDPDLIYYASGHDVYCLNTESKSRTHICHVPFQCRCTAAGYGYVCVAGGEKGNFTIIQVDGVERHRDGDVDSLLPVGLNERLIGRPTPGVSPPKVKVENIGEEIINSITIHKFSGEQHGDTDEVVAVITSNDRTVRVYSLTFGYEAARLELPFPMNHASISPDGDLMLAVGDWHQAYFYERITPDSTSPLSKTCSRASEWEMMNIVHLHCPVGVQFVGYFTTAWSPSGGLCAAGSECGYVSVFDTDLVRQADLDEDPVVEVIESTRPENRAGPGAIRSMLFSPHPWDLLVWAEDRGRVVVADIRAGLRVRQVIKLDPEDAGVQKVEIQDFSSSTTRLDELSRIRDHRDSSNAGMQAQLLTLQQQVEHFRRYRMALDADVDSVAAGMNSEFLELLSERQRIRRLTAAVEEDPNGLTAEERQVVDALRTHDGQDEREFGTGPLFDYFTSENDSHYDGRQSAHSLGRRPRPSDDTSISLARVRDYIESSEPTRSTEEPRRQGPALAATDHVSGRSSMMTMGRPSVVPPYSRNTNQASSLTDAMRIIESAWNRDPSAPTNMTAVLPRPRTPPPHALSSDIHAHLMSTSARSSDSDMLHTDTPAARDQTDNNSNPLRRRAGPLSAPRAIEEHNRLVSQLRHQASAASSSSTVPPPPAPSAPSPYGIPITFSTSPAAVRPTSSSSTASPSPPTTSAGIRRAAAALRRAPSDPRPRSRSRISDRLSDFEARVRHMSRLNNDPQTLNFLQRRGYESPEWGNKSAGLAMSGNGGKLWCASEKGILEVNIDLWARRGFPAEKFA